MFDEEKPLKSIYSKLEDIENALKSIDSSIFSVQTIVDSIDSTTSKPSQNKILENEMLYYYHFQNKLMEKQYLDTIKNINVKYKNLNNLNIENDSFIIQGNLNEIEKLIKSKKNNVIILNIDYTTPILELISYLKQENTTILLLLNSILINADIVSKILQAIFEKKVTMTVGSGPSASQFDMKINNNQIILAFEDIRQLNLAEINFPVYSYKN